ncbi:hypothetical protein [Flavihumibacter sp. UBA7668]|uniref:hypothetical protein n=1 Tax=Flavihumibacter sp. UBA7668 TaxID=1946542 RepID=UPI0025B89063|nr:hypothetical protein [Flavihumibacter sp. UBA7668]
MGSKSSLYQYGYYQSGGEALPSQQNFYTFEKAAGSFIFLKNILNKKFKAKLKEFYKNSPGVQEIIDSKLKYWLDLNTES